MTTIDQSLDTCPGCGIVLPRVDGPTHRYIGASAPCWGLYCALTSGTVPAVEIPALPRRRQSDAMRVLSPPPRVPAPPGELVVDAYAAQHPGTPSPRSIQSVAVHLLALHGVLARDVDITNVLWIRRRALRERGCFRWLQPPRLNGTMTVAHVAVATPDERDQRWAELVGGVYECWMRAHGATIAAWYERYVLA